MTPLRRRVVLLGAPAALALGPVMARAQTPLRIEITEGVIEPLPFAAPEFLAGSAGADELARDITAVVVNNLTGTGLFREIPRSAHIGRVTTFDAPVDYADWRAINAQALITGQVRASGDQVIAQFRLWDVFAQSQMEGLQFEGNRRAWRRLGHRISDAVYRRLTGEDGYFDSRIAFIAESGPKTDRRKRLAIMDQDGANVEFLTDGAAMVLAPRFSPDARRVIYTSYEQRQPRVFMMDIASRQRQVMEQVPGMSFAPRFSPDGRQVVFSAASGGGTNIYTMDVATRARRQLTQSAGIDTAPSFSPSGDRIVFESDRGGGQQIYIMSAGGGEARRISFGEGRYATPVWSPRGDLVAFTKMVGGRFHIGVMRTDGSDERLLTASFLDEGPTWAPNGRVLMFFRESPGDQGGPQLYSVDVTGRNLRRVATPGFASDPAWSGLLS